MRKKDFYLILDTETCNGFDLPLVYDIGYAITDRQGNIYVKRSFVVYEIFVGEKQLMKSSYYNCKIPSYWNDIKSGKRILKSFSNIRKQILDDIQTYNVKYIGAYNMDFDKRALNSTIAKLTNNKETNFFDTNTNFVCIWHMACQVIMTQKRYHKFCNENNFISKKGNISTSAENCYRYLIKNADFIESHTGLEDVEIEIQIMTKCYKTHKKMTKKINTSCWKIPQIA